MIMVPVKCLTRTLASHDLLTTRTMDIVDGFLNINKPAGWTSHDVVAKMRGLLKIKKVGHTGTLDPMATGVLPICFGKGTKIAQYLIEEEKGYEAVMRLGESTDTQDASGRTMKKVDISNVDTNSVYEVAREFLGRISQVPPMYSAIKVGGSPLYKRARAGETIDRRPREVMIKDIKVLAIEGRDVTLDVECSKGTYIRTLCYDIGERLGVGAHLLRLKRWRSGLFAISDAVTIEQIEDLIKAGNLYQVVYTLDRVLSTLPVLVVNETTANRIVNGLPSVVNDIGRGQTQVSLENGKKYRIHDKDGRLIAIAYLGAQSNQESETCNKRRLKIERVLIS